MRKSLTGIVLAGGVSSRLGHDKVVLPLTNGRAANMLARSVSLLDEVCGETLVIGREQAGYVCFQDRIPGCGPVGGIATALEIIDTACLVLSCDLPFMELSVLEKLVQEHEARPSGMLCTSYQQEDTGHTEALVAVYERECLPYFQACAQERRLKISQVVPQERQHRISYSADDSLPFFNINYPADLEIARRMLQMLGRG